MGVEKLLDRLHKVKRTGNDKWIACCPAHEDKTPSLAIRQTDNLQILVHCFGAGCDALTIIGAVGLEASDLFPPNTTHEHRKPVSQPFTAADALRCLTREAGVAAIMAADLASGAPIDTQRCALSAERIAEAACYVGAL
jgi:hypothetical protein